MIVNKNNIFIFIISLVLFSCDANQSNNSNPVSKDSITPSANTIDSTRSKLMYLSDCKKLKSEAKRMDSILLKELEVKNDVANKAIKAFTDFAYYCSSDSLSPVYLIKTAQVAQSINNTSQAKLALEKCIDSYLKSKHRPAALFLLAQLYDETVFLNNEEEAKKLYQQIIDEYPKSDWAKSSKGALKFIGKTDEQIMEELKKK